MRRLILMVLTGLICSLSSQAAEPETSWNIVVLHSGNFLHTASTVLDRAMVDTVTTRSARRVEFHPESLDTLRIPAINETEFSSYLESKYRSLKPDLIITVGPAALDFAQKHSPSLWPGTPIVFYSVRPESLAGRDLGANTTGQTISFDIAGSVALALRLHPTASEMVIAAGTTPYDQKWVPLVEEQIRKHAPNLKIRYLTNETLSELQLAAAKLPADSIVFLTSLSRDGSGQTHFSNDVAARLSAASSVPVYSFFETYVGEGIVGGSVTSLREQGRAAGELALRVLGGEKAESIAPQPPPPSVPTVDWRQLKRWRIDQKLLPADCAVEFYQAGFWQKYRWALLGLIAVGLPQSALIAGLLAQRRRRRRFEKALRESEERNRAIVAAIPDMMFILDKNGVYLDYHAPDPRRLVVPPDQLLGRKVQDIMPAELAAKFRRCFEEVLRTGKTQTVEYTLNLHGTGYFFEAQIVRSGEDQLLSIVRDITERKRAEEGLRNIASGVSAKTGETFFRSLVEHIGKVLQADYAFVCEVYDQGRRAQTLASYVHGKHVENVNYPLEGSPCEQVIQLGEVVFPTRIKTSFPFDSILQEMDVEGYLGVCLKDSAGQPHGLMSVMSSRPLADVENSKAILRIFAARASAELERKQVEDKLRVKEQDLRRSEERYREVVESQTEMVCRHLPDTTLTFVNEAYCRCFGRKREDLIGRKFLELLPEASRKHELEQIAAVTSSGASVSLEREVQLPDGTVAWHLWTTLLASGAEGQLEFQAIGRDITDRKRAEEMRQNLAHASRLAVVGELTAMVAHELNQPLGAILTNVETAEMLLDQEPASLDEIRRILTDVRRDDLRAADAIQRLRALLRKREAEMQALDLNETVSEVLRLINADSLRRGVQIHRTLSRPLPSVLGDRMHLQHVLLNLLLNSMEAMSDNARSNRHLFVSTAWHGDGFVEVTVRDVGHGIPSDNLERVFDSFFTTKKDGMGLGLSIARSIIDLHAGRIWAQNNPDGKGVSIRFTVPVLSRKPELSHGLPGSMPPSKKAFAKST